MRGFIYIAGEDAPQFSVVAIHDKYKINATGTQEEKQSVIDAAYELHLSLSHNPQKDEDPALVEALQRLANALLFGFQADPTQALFTELLQNNTTPGHWLLWCYRENNVLKFRTAQRFFTEDFAGPMPVSSQHDYIEILAH